MTITDRDIEIIESYFNRTLSEEDNQAFEQRLQTDSDFKKAVNEYQATTAILNTVREREQKAFLKNIEATMPPVGMPIRRLDFRWRAIAAVGLVLVTVGVWQFWGSDSGSVKLKSPIADYFEPYRAYGINKGEDDDIKQNALRTYATSDFEKAIPLLETAFQKDTKDSTLLLYLSISYIANGQLEKAKQKLEVLQNSSAAPLDVTEYYLALIYASENRQSEAIILLEKVANTEGGYFRDKARELLNKLKKG